VAVIKISKNVCRAALLVKPEKKYGTRKACFLTLTEMREEIDGQMFARDTVSIL